MGECFAQRGNGVRVACCARRSPAFVRRRAGQGLRRLTRTARNCLIRLFADQRHGGATAFLSAQRYPEEVSPKSLLPPRRAFPACPTQQLFPPPRRSSVPLTPEASSLIRPHRRPCRSSEPRSGGWAKYGRWRSPPTGRRSDATDAPHRQALKRRLDGRRFSK